MKRITALVVFIFALSVCASVATALPSGWCGDGICQSWLDENSATCYSDCDYSFPTHCGDGTCQPWFDEDSATCYSDCGESNPVPEPEPEPEPIPPAPSCEWQWVSEYCSACTLVSNYDDFCGHQDTKYAPNSPVCCSNPVPPPPPQPSPPPPAPYCTPKDFCSGNYLYHRSSDCSESLIKYCDYGCSNNKCNNPPQPPPPAAPFCGDNKCNNGETCSTCQYDCGSCPVPPPPTQFCGDNICNNGETCLTCQHDCGSCPVIVCPYQSTQALVKGSNGVYVNFIEIGQGESVKVYGFHNHVTTPASDVTLTISGPSGQFTIINGATFAPQSAGVYKLSVTTSGFSDFACMAQATIRVKENECDPQTTPSKTIPCGMMCGSKNIFCGSDGKFQETACMDQGVCVPGAEDTSMCPAGGFRSCSASCQWNSCQNVGVCFPGTVEAQSCGLCGLKYRTCGSDYQWNEFGPCTNQGVCSPGSKDDMACGLNGVQERTCTDACMWGDFGSCVENKECDPGQIDQRSCGNCGKQIRVCQSNGFYTGFGQCTGQGVCSPGQNDTQSCGIDGERSRSCSDVCQWGSFSSCHENAVCSPGAQVTQSCGMCGVKTDVCSQNGQWLNGTCAGQHGVCSPGQIDSVACGVNGTQSRSCSDSCSWGGFGECQDTPGLQCMPGTTQTEACGASGMGVCNRGTTSRSCQANYKWGTWSICSGSIEPTREVCNGLDDDCDGHTDEGVSCENFLVKSVQILNEGCVNPGEDVVVRVALDNSGDVDYEDMRAAISSDLLDLYSRTERFDMDDGDDVVFTVSAQVPEGTIAGLYDLRITIGDEVDVARTVYRDFRVVTAYSCESAGFCYYCSMLNNSKDLNTGDTYWYN